MVFFAQWSCINTICRITKKWVLIYITDLSAEVLNRFKWQVFSHKIFDVFLDVGTPNRYEKANNLRKLKI
jgi:hypothetical protein